MKHHLYIIMGYNNVYAWEKDNDFEDIDIDKVYHFEFNSQEEKQAFINGVYTLDNNLHNMEGNYCIINEEEYNSLMSL